MSTTDDPPRFFKVFISIHSSESMLIPISYYDELPRRLPKTAILQGNGGCVWTVGVKKRGDEVYFERGWPKFVKENSLTDGDFMTFVYNGDNMFEVTIFELDDCKEIRAVAEVEDEKEEDSINTISSDDSESEISKSKNKGKSIVDYVEDSDEENDNGNGDDDYIEEFDRLDFEEESNNESSYATVSEDIITYVKPKGTKPKKKEMPKIKNPEAYLDDSENIYFKTIVQNRKFDLFVKAEIVKDYRLKFRDRIYLIDNHKDGKLQVKTTSWKDRRVSIKGFGRIRERNKLEKGDWIVCEILRKRSLVHAVKIHIVQKEDMLTN